MTHYEMAYVTLDEVVTQLDLVDEAAFSTTTSANTRISAQDANTRTQLKRFIYEVSDDLYTRWFRDFVPYVDTLTVYANDYEWSRSWTAKNNTYVFDLSRFANRDLLSVDSITLNGTAISSSYYRLDTSDGYPAQRIIFDGDNVTFPASYDFDTSIVIVGTWGYHDQPGNMWSDSGDTVQNAPQISASGTTLTVTSGSNFETYQYIKIEDEFLFITSISGTTLTVQRGVNGTTASAHANGTTIYTYKQTASVRKDVRRMVLREYMLRNGVNLVVAVETIQDITTGDFKINIPKRWALGSV